MKNNILDLDGKELEKELQKIIEKSRKESRSWTEKERTILKKLWTEKVPYSVISEKLGRTTNGIDKQLRNLGLARPPHTEQ